jgi:hypothetical protein
MATVQIPNNSPDIAKYWKKPLLCKGFFYGVSFEMMMGATVFSMAVAGIGCRSGDKNNEVTWICVELFSAAEWV